MKTWIVVAALVVLSVVGGSAQGGYAGPEITSIDNSIFVSHQNNNPNNFVLTVNDMKVLDLIEEDCKRERIFLKQYPNAPAHRICQ